MTKRIAELVGSISQPELALTFDRNDKHPVTGENLMTWVKALPGRRWDGRNQRWMATALGSNPDQAIKSAGFELILDGPDRHPSLNDVFSLAELIPPLVKQSSDRPAVALVRMRFSGFDRTRDILGAGGSWDKENQRFEVRLADLVSTNASGKKAVDKRMEFVGDTAESAIMATLAEAPTDATLAEAAASTAMSTGLDMTKNQTKAMKKLIKQVGDVPSWFNMALYPYQRLGAIAAASGRYLLADSPGLGKGSPSWVKILTPTGWTTYGDVGVGDQVIGSNGQATTVTGVFPRGELDVFRVTMNDGSSVVVDGDHLWTVKSTRGRQTDAHSRTLSTRELMAEGLNRTDSSAALTSYAHFIPMVEPVQFAAAPAPLPIDPYVLGVLLGDGHITPRGAASFVSADPQIAEEFAVRLPDGVSLNRWKDQPDRHPTYAISKTVGFGGGKSNPVAIALREMGLPGLHSDTKFIPEQYLYATPNERLDLLRGLFDTDGHAGAALEYVTVSPHLADGVKFLVQSLGGQVRIATKKPTYKDRNGDKQSGKTAYRVIVTMPAHLNPFLLDRKRDAWKAPFKYGPMRNIRSIEPAGREEVTCISVDAQDQLYVTEDFIVTHNTRQALATACIKEAHRTLIIVPPVVVTHWGREVEESGLNANCHGDIVIFSARKKEPALPDRGVVVIPDSLLVSRPALAAAISEWGPDFFIYDEAHRARNWTSKRSKVVRDLTDSLTDGVPRICITGTPIFSTPQELAPILAMTGHLDPVFGGYSNFLQTYCRQNHFKAWVPRKNMLPQLRQMLAEHVWVRRLKADVLKDLPKKSRVGQFVDVDLRGYRAAHDEVVEKLVVYLVDFYNENGRFPSDEENESWAKQQIGVISPLRKAAGVAKVPHALDLISEWVDNNTLETPADDGSLYDRPYLVWAHHGEVIEALRAGIAAFPDGVKTAVEIIDGSTSVAKRGEIVDEFQAGKIGVLIASITAAGVGITLTRGSDALFVETDWTPALVSQAEDRCVLEGQPVVTESGPKNIENIEVGDLVLTHEGNWKPVTDVWSRLARINGPTGRWSRKLITSLGYTGSQSTLDVTHDHEVLVRRTDGTTEWAWASTVLPGEELATPRPVGEGIKALEFPRRQSWSTVSPTLSAQMKVLAAAQSHRTLTYLKPAGQQEINKGTISNTRPAYLTEYTEWPTDGNHVWRKVNSVSTRYARRDERVWDITVADDNSYVVHDVAVHNCARIGQTQPVICETLIAEGTLDERIQQVLQTKALTLNEVLGGDEADVAVMELAADKITPSEIVMNLLGMAKVKAKKELGVK